MRALFPGVRLGYCLRHALLKLPGKLMGIASPVRKALRAQFHTLLHRARQRKGLRVSLNLRQSVGESPRPPLLQNRA
jgi:hypothetical protein